MISFSRLLCAVLFMLILIVGECLAQEQNSIPEGRLSFRNYSTDLGLPSLMVYSLLQDRQGFIWVGTESGLFRYNGYRFTAFGLQDGLPSNEVKILHQDARGILWIGTREGLVRWNGHALEAVSKSSGLPSIAVLGLSDMNGQLWVATNQGPFVQLSDGQFVRANDWVGGGVTAMLKSARSESIWVASWNGSTHIQVRQDNAWRAIEISPGMEKVSIDAMAEDGQGRLWAKAPRSLWVLEKDGVQFKQAITPVPFVSDRGHIQAGTHGDIWVPTQDGLMHLQDDRWTSITAAEGLPTTWCLSMLVDREGSLWIGSTGLYRFLGGNAWRTYTRTSGLPSDIVWNIFRDRTQQLWVGTDNGLARATKKGWESNPKTIGRGIRTVVQGADNALYLAGTPGTDVLRYDLKSQQIQSIPLSKEIVPSRILRLLVDRSGILWAATDKAGLFKADTAQSAVKFERVSLPNGEANDYVGSVHQDDEGRIWVSGARGLALLENGIWKLFGVKDGLKRDQIAYVRTRKNGQLMLSYSDSLGVTVANYKDGKLTVVQNIDSSNVLQSNTVYLFGEDANEHMWIGTAKGLDRLMPHGVEHFGTPDGLISEDVNNMSLFAESNGDMWVGTSGGLAYFEAKAYRQFDPNISTNFLALSLGKDSYLDHPEKTTVEYSANTFEAHFANLHFLKEASIKQQVRLVGLESEWRTTNTHEARYPALPYGQYRFEVRSQIEKGAFGPVASFDFEILPPWWHTWWFRLLAGLAFIAVIILLVRWRLHTLREQNQLLEALVAERTRELEVSNIALKNQSLSDPLTGLRNRRFVSECMPDYVAQANRLKREASGRYEERMALNINLLLIMVDVDHFKHVNDQYGHPAGDKVLQQMAQIMHDASRDTDTVVRWGGEEFLVVGRQVCMHDFSLLPERIRSKVEAWPFDIGNGEIIHLTCSVGFALYPSTPEHAENTAWERVVDVADRCLYMAKRNGRNAWVGVCTQPGHELDVVTTVTPENMIGLISTGELLVYQSFPSTTVLDWAS